jgi:hypothetical protein
LVSLCGLLLARAAFAQAAPPIDLHWDAPAACPRESDVRNRIEQLVGSQKPSENRLRADGAITQTDDGRFQLKLMVRSGSLVGERQIESNSCADLAGAAAVTLALLLHSTEPLSQQDLGGRNSASSRAGTGPNSAQPKVGPDASSHGAPVAPYSSYSARSWRALVQAPALAFGIGPLPHPTVGFGVAGGAAFEDWRFSLQLTEWLAQDLPAPDLPGYGAHVALLTAGAGVCRAFRAPPFEIAPCLTLSLEHVTARGVGDHITPHTQATTWLAPGAGAQARLYLASWFSVMAAVNGQVETARPRISIDGVGDIDLLGPAALTVTVGPEWIL